MVLTWITDASSDEDRGRPPLIVMPSREGDLVWFRGGEVDIATGRFAHVDYGGAVAGVAADELTITPCLTGAAPMLRAGTFRRLWGFDESLFLYWEDVDLSLRAISEGLRLGVATDLVISHDEGRTSGSSGEHSAIYYRYMARNRIVVCAKHGASVSSLLLGRGLRETFRSCVILPLREKSGRLAKMRAAVRGLLGGVSHARQAYKAATGSR